MAYFSAFTVVGYSIGMASPLLVQNLIDSIVKNAADLNQAALIAGGLIVLTLAGAQVDRWHHASTQYLALYLRSDLSRRLHMQLLRMNTDEPNISSASILGKFERISVLESFTLYHLPGLIFDGGRALLAIAIIFSYDIWVFGAVLGALVLVAFLSSAGRNAYNPLVQSWMPLLTRFLPNGRCFLRRF